MGNDQTHGNKPFISPSSTSKPINKSTHPKMEKYLTWEENKLPFSKFIFSDLVSEIKLRNLQNSNDSLSEQQLDSFIKQLFGSDETVSLVLKNKKCHDSSDENKMYSIKDIINKFFVISVNNFVKVKDDKFISDKAFYIYNTLPKNEDDEITKEVFSEFLNTITQVFFDNIYEVFMKNLQKDTNNKKIYENIQKNNERVKEEIIMKIIKNDQDDLDLEEINKYFEENNEFLSGKYIMDKAFELYDK
jgi:uncharacterized membrane-anchored protein YjiN (DUF445 family)